MSPVRSPRLVQAAAEAGNYMNAEIVGEWLRRQGYRVVLSRSSGWYAASPHVFQAFPFHWVIRPSREELAGVLGRHAVGLRYSTPLDAPEGRLSYHMVRTRPYGLEALERRTRQGVRKGLEQCRVERISLERLAEEGWALEADTWRRQGRKLATSPEVWRRHCLAAVDLAGFEAWGAIVDGRLASSLLAVRVGDCLELLSQQCLTAFLEAHVNNALAFTVTRDALNRPGIDLVFYTLQSLDAPSSVDVFKLRMGFVAVPVRQRVVFHPWLAPALRPMESLVHACATRLPGRTFLTKADGMFRFHREGLLPLAQQPCPEILLRSNAAPGPAAAPMTAVAPAGATAQASPLQAPVREP